MAKEYIVMFPYMAQGHLIPFLALANLISKRFPHYTVSLVNTPVNIQNLQKSIPTDSTIHLHSLPFLQSSDYGLPPGSENTDALPVTHWIRLFQASESLQPGFVRLLSDLTRQRGRPPLLIIADVFLGWTAEVAKELNIFHVSFTVYGAYGAAAYFSLWLNLPHTRTDLPEFNIPGFPEDFRIDRTQLPVYMRAADGNDPWSIFFRRQISHSLKSNAMISNTVEELETEGLRLLRQNTGLRVWTIGPLLPLDSNSAGGRTGKRAGAGVVVEDVIEWLDSHLPSSVLYISFGSQNTISSSQMMSLATGLESSGHAFIWVVRPPVGFDPKSDFRPEWLPEGFESRVKEKNQGLLVRGWAPQLEILSHRSTGAFLSHCGWNSVLESLSRGVAIIGWPLAAEQFYNTIIVEKEWGVGVELARGVGDEVGSEKVKRFVKLVMEDEKGKEMKAKATRLRKTIRDAMREDEEVKGSSIRAIDEFIEAAISSKSEK